MSRTALALSPHLDDAVFSCGGTLALLARAGWRVVLATLFTRTVPDPRGFALACQLDKGLAADVDYMALRRAEDVAAAEVLGIDAPAHVPLPEAPHRGYGSAAALFGDRLPSDDVAEALDTAITALVNTEAPDLILAPQAVGRHVDHVAVVDALGGVAAPVLWWRDFPYALRGGAPAEPFQARMTALPNRTVRLDAAALRVKQAACLAYRSQIGFQFGGSDGLRAKLAEAGDFETFRGPAVLDLTP